MHHPTCHAMPCRACFFSLASLLSPSSFSLPLSRSRFRLITLSTALVAHMTTTVGKAYVCMQVNGLNWYFVCRHRDSCSVSLDWLVMRFVCSRQCVICCENKYVSENEREREEWSSDFDVQCCTNSLTGNGCVWHMPCDVAYGNLHAKFLIWWHRALTQMCWKIVIRRTNQIESNRLRSRSLLYTWTRDAIIAHRRDKKQCMNVILVALDGHSIRFPYRPSCTSWVTQIGAAQQWQPARYHP